MLRRSFAAALALQSAAAAANPSAHGVHPAASLCQPHEVTIFACPIRNKIAAVCGRGGTALYRFGLPGHIELEATGLALAEHSYSGGGEAQIGFDKGGYRYIVYDSTVRTSFGRHGKHDAALHTGIIVQKDDKTIADSNCSGTSPAGISAAAAKFIPPGKFVEH